MQPTQKYFLEKLRPHFLHTNLPTITEERCPETTFKNYVASQHNCYSRLLKNQQVFDIKIFCSTNKEMLEKLHKKIQIEEIYATPSFIGLRLARKEYKMNLDISAVLVPYQRIQRALRRWVKPEEVKFGEIVFDIPSDFATAEIVEHIRSLRLPAEILDFYCSGTDIFLCVHNSNWPDSFCAAQCVKTALYCFVFKNSCWRDFVDYGCVGLRRKGVLFKVYFLGIDDCGITTISNKKELNVAENSSTKKEDNSKKVLNDTQISSTNKEDNLKIEFNDEISKESIQSVNNHKKVKLRKKELNDEILKNNIIENESIQSEENSKKVKLRKKELNGGTMENSIIENESIQSEENSKKVKLRKKEKNTIQNKEIEGDENKNNESERELNSEKIELCGSKDECNGEIKNNGVHEKEDAKLKGEKIDFDWGGNDKNSFGFNVSLSLKNDNLVYQFMRYIDEKPDYWKNNVKMVIKLLSSHGYTPIYIPEIFIKLMCINLESFFPAAFMHELFFKKEVFTLNLENRKIENSAFYGIRFNDEFAQLNLEGAVKTRFDQMCDYFTTNTYSIYNDKFELLTENYLIPSKSDFDFVISRDERSGFKKTTKNNKMESCIESAVDCVLNIAYVFYSRNTGLVMVKCVDINDLNLVFGVLMTKINFEYFWINEAQI